MLLIRWVIRLPIIGILEQVVPADTSNLLNPTFNYSTPGDFITSFQVSSPVGCVAKAYDSVHVIGPFPMPVSPDTTICIGGMAYLHA